jgi:hypothetical protein
MCRPIYTHTDTCIIVYWKLSICKPEETRMELFALLERQGNVQHSVLRTSQPILFSMALLWCLKYKRRKIITFIFYIKLTYIRRLTSAGCMYAFYLTTLFRNSDYIALNKIQWTMNWNTCVKAIVAYFKALFRHLPGGTEENREKNTVTIASLRAEIWTRDLPNTKQKCWNHAPMDVICKQTNVPVLNRTDQFNR